jgi:undecaprenyl diphosphate synthase
MDGNGRWAKQRFLPRVAGHKRGLEAVRATVKACIQRGVEYLTLFAFSSENWRRPQDEVKFLMQLFVAALEQEIEKLHAHGVRFRAVGDLTRFEPRIVRLVADAETLTAANDRLQLTVAANYGGRWDILQAMNRMMKERPPAGAGYTESDLTPYFAMSYAPEPDLFVRTGGEQRISNFLLWQLAYTELYFTTRSGRTLARTSSIARSFPIRSASDVSAAPANNCRRVAESPVLRQADPAIERNGSAGTPTRCS